MKQFAVFGDPIDHSLSPQIHQAFAEQVGLSLSYQRQQADAENLSEKLTDFFASGGTGANITSPGKEGAYHLVSEHSARAKQAQAVNTISLLPQGRWYGDYTDGVGLLRDLQKHCQSLAKEKILFIGAGAVVSGLVASLFGQGGCRQIDIASRRHASAYRISQQFPEMCKAYSLADLNTKEYSVIIHASSAGLSGECPALPADFQCQNALCYDLSYGKAAQPFLAFAEQAGAAICLDGLGLLVEQAAESFLTWHHLAVKTDKVLADLRLAIPGLNKLF